MEPLAVVTRSGYIESIHYGFICIVNSSGNVLQSLGDYNIRIYFRSSAKPIQVLPLISSGAADTFKFSPKEIALACASHSGQSVHQLITKEILKKLELEDTSLHCGIMTPYNQQENNRLLADRTEPSVFHCSCSGKHAAMLALAKFRGYNMENYEHPDHPLQQEILETVCKFTEEEINSVTLGVDGCGVPIYLLPINKIALSYARLTAISQDQSHAYHQSCKAVFDAMNQFPEMVSGDNEFCTELMKHTNGKLIGKAGSEAVYCLGIKNKNIGICIKIIDGNERALYPIVIKLLRDLEIIDDNEFSKLVYWYKPSLKNNLGEETGHIIPIFDLNNPRTDANLLGKQIHQFLQ